MIPTQHRRNFTRQRANSFLVGVLFDQQVNADQAWAAAEWITESIGDQDGIVTLIEGGGKGLQ